MNKTEILKQIEDLLKKSSREEIIELVKNLCKKDVYFLEDLKSKL